MKQSGLNCDPLAPTSPIVAIPPWFYTKGPETYFYFSKSHIFDLELMSLTISSLCISQMEQKWCIDTWEMELWGLLFSFPIMSGYDWLSALYLFLGLFSSHLIHLNFKGLTPRLFLPHSPFMSLYFSFPLQFLLSLLLPLILKTLNNSLPYVFIHTIFALHFLDLCSSIFLLLQPEICLSLFEPVKISSNYQFPSTCSFFLRYEDVPYW